MRARAFNRLPFLLLLFQRWLLCLLLNLSEEMMRSLALLWVLILMVATALPPLALSRSRAGSADSNPGSETASDVEDSKVVIINRKVKERSYEIGIVSTRTFSGSSINMEDYPRYDPAPSSKAAIKHGPIEHGTPLRPYIPQPTPPSHPKHGHP